jgi:hypothetical protein
LLTLLFLEATRFPVYGGVGAFPGEFMSGGSIGTEGFHSKVILKLSFDARMYLGTLSVSLRHVV